MRKARKRKARRNPAKRKVVGTKTRPVLYKKRRKYYASPSTRSITSGTRINPSRRRKSYRRNPALLKGFSIKNLLKQLEPIAYGAIGGTGVNMLFNRFVILQNEKLVPWLKLAVAAAMPLVIKKGVLGQSAKYGAVVLGAAALKNLATQFMPNLALDGYEYDPVSNSIQMLGSETVSYPTSFQGMGGDIYSMDDPYSVGSETLVY